MGSCELLVISRYLDVLGSELTAMEFPGLVAVSILVCLTRGGAKDFIPSFFSMFLLADQGEALLSPFQTRKGRGHLLLNHTFRTLPPLNPPLQKVGIQETETMSRRWN